MLADRDAVLACLRAARAFGAGNTTTGLTELYLAAASSDAPPDHQEQFGRRGEEIQQAFDYCRAAVAAAQGKDCIEADRLLGLAWTVLGSQHHVWLPVQIQGASNTMNMWSWVLRGARDHYDSCNAKFHRLCYDVDLDE